jgi:hypothetical protein
MSTEKLKDVKPYQLPPALKLAAEKAKKQQPDLIAISGRVRYVNLESDR